VAAAARPALVEAATVDHGLRPESAAEAELVACICNQLSVPHATLRIAVENPPRSNVQAWARTERYRMLEDWATGRGLQAIATAHHADDQAETLLMRLARGAGAGGLAGIQRRRALGPATSLTLVRPLLGWRREELRDIVANAGLTPVDDLSNADEQFDRTHARRLLADTPWLQPERLAVSAANLGDAEEALDWAAAQEIRFRTASRESSITFDPAGLPRELKRRVLATLIGSLGGDEPPGPKLIAALDRLDADGTTTLAGLKLEGGATWRVSRAPPRRPR
jgi:tRNA(Ile)-lysidine synthase